MSVTKSSIIDAAAVEKETNTLVLLIVDQQPWIGVEEGHIKLIQNKLRNYVRYIEEKQWQSEYRNENFSNFRIEIKFYYQYPEIFVKYLNKYKDKLEMRNIQVTYERIRMEKNK